MGLFFRRFIGALVLDAAAFEEVEGDPRSGLQSTSVVVLAAAAAGMAVMGWDLIDPVAFIGGIAFLLTGWVVWIGLISAIGTIALPEPETRSSTIELMRTLGFAAAPGVWLVFASMRAVAPLVVAVVAVWMIAATVIGMRQALDYRSTVRAMVVCVAGWVIAFGVLAGVAALLSREVN
jgi:hypothetical protein